MTNGITIWLVDDHVLFRSGFKTLLSKLPDVKVTYEAADGTQFLDHLRTTTERPNIIFMDISMPQMDGVEATRAAMSNWTDLNIVILSMFGEREYYQKLVDLGIKGFLLKSCDFKEVENAINTIMNGDMYFSEELMMQISMPNAPGSEICGDDELSDREMEVLIGICNGESNQEIADRLFISKRTVEKHRANLMMKTGCANTASIVVYAVKRGLYKIEG